MNVPMKWLNDFVNIDTDIDTYCDAMTMAGQNVETYEKLGQDIDKIVVGKILEIKPHEDADKLVVTQVDVGSEVVQVVTGAKNINEGDVIPVALAGAHLPGGVKIKKGKLRGVESNGMMCSVEELGFSPDDFEEAPEDGIYIFQDEMALGIDVKPFFGLDDVVVEYEVTSNRPDCFSIMGLAREAAVAFKKEFKYPDVSFDTIEGDPSSYASVTIEDEKLCARYMGRIVKNVKIAPSPKWMQQRLIAAGLRPINNIVDITNYIMTEMGQPMHAFDVETLEEQQIIIRNAKKGEQIISLDGEERELDETMLVIADAKKPIAIAGIIGGENTKITEKTTTVLFEAANFDGTCIRHSTKKLGLRTDAAAKFVKYLDPNNVEAAMDRACHLITLLGVGDVVCGEIDAYPAKRTPITVGYNPESINRLLGTDIAKSEMEDIFKGIECEVDSEKNEVTVPTFRPDITAEPDLAEEVARFYGYNNIPTTLDTGTPTVGKKSYFQRIEDVTQLIMENCGISEAFTYSFESPKVFDKLTIAEDSKLRDGITITNPLGEDFSMMRTTTLNGMLASLALNYNRRNENVKLYEMGKVYMPKSLPLTELPTESKKLTIGMYGNCDFFDIKGVVETLINKLSFNDKVSYNPSVEAEYLHPGRRAQILVDETKEIGIIGEVHPDVCDNYEIEERAYIAVLDMAMIVEYANLDHSYTQVPKYPAVNRDLAFLVKDDILVADIEKILKQRGGKTLESFQLFDVYKGEQIGEGYKSIAYSLVFRAKDHTLGEKEINKVMDKILNGLEYELEAKLRK